MFDKSLWPLDRKSDVEEGEREVENAIKNENIDYPVVVELMKRIALETDFISSFGDEAKITVQPTYSGICYSVTFKKVW